MFTMVGDLQSFLVRTLSGTERFRVLAKGLSEL